MNTVQYRQTERDLGRRRRVC